MYRIRISALTLCMFFLLALPFSAAAGKLYRWVDDKGNVHYSDRVPPEHVRSERAVLDEHGIEVKRVEAAKTREEIAREKELKRRRTEQQRLIEEQKATDRVLLRTFRSEDDIKMARDGKLASIDVHIQVAQSNIKRLKEKLAQMQKNAADLERQGKPVSARYLEELGSLRQQMKVGYASILQKERDKEQLWDDSERDLQRFRKLKKLELEKPEKAPEEKFTMLLETVVVCTDKTTCDTAWSRAESYIREHASTPLQMLSDTIVMTALPVRDDEYSLTVSRLKREEGASTEIFLDLQCKGSPAGKEFCNGQKARAVRSGFRKALLTTGQGD